MKVLIASDKFKGTLTAKEVADLISEGLSDHECVLKPVADGGEATSDILGHSLGVTTFEVSVQGPDGRCVSAPIKIAFSYCKTKESRQSIPFKSDPAAPGREASPHVLEGI